jgi:hypothetical protein
MRKLLEGLVAICVRPWKKLWAIVSVFYPAGRTALLRRTEARTRLDELAAEQKQLEIETKRANNVIDLLVKLEKIKDPAQRERVRALIVANQSVLAPPDGEAA